MDAALVMDGSRSFQMQAAAALQACHRLSLILFGGPPACWMIMAKDRSSTCRMLFLTTQYIISKLWSSTCRCIINAVMMPVVITDVHR